ncbi:hypothetical protein BGZ76_004763 [Entomortierella beljakovae]|nr:hypothetical protein BGZ76_004763 [Entomortierella beljakovae]
MSGIKASALLFHKIYSLKRKAVKRELLVSLIKDERLNDGTKAQDILADQLRLIPKDEEELTLKNNYDASNLLRQLAGTMAGTITSKNTTIVAQNIQSTIDRILQEKLSKNEDKTAADQFSGAQIESL